MNQSQYDTMIRELHERHERESDLTAISANTAALLFYAFNSGPMPSVVNWCGFYFVKPASTVAVAHGGGASEGGRFSTLQLVLGPFCGKAACIRINHGDGVCGAAWQQRKTIVVPDVHQFPGHIACDDASQSEIVVPLLAASGDVVAVLDIDSPRLHTFKELDKTNLERIAVFVTERCRSTFMSQAGV